jgi:hypothetical protein
MLHLLRPPIRIRNGGAIVRISDDLRKCVVFFATKNTKGTISYGGTGFLVHAKVDKGVVPYIVTARHVAQHLDLDFFIRANLNTGEAREIPVEVVEWVYPDDKTVDLAVTPFSFSAREYDHSYYGLDDIYPPSDMVMCGDEIAIVGLFRLHKGTNRNIAIVHSGHVATLADEQERIPLKRGCSSPIIRVVAHLVEAQTLNGLSGSPVFVQCYIKLVNSRATRAKWGVDPLTCGEIKLFGIYQGAWDAEPGEILAADRGLDGSTRVPVGMGLVVPAEKLIELINNCKQAHADKGYIVKLEEHPAVMDSGFGLAEESVTHKEDFTALLNAAVRKPQPKN